MTKIIYYTKANGENPVREFIMSLNPRQKKKIVRLLKYVEEYGLTTAIPHVRKLAGLLLWELRILGNDNLRIIYALIVNDSIILLHGFMKKKQQTPRKEIELALNRLVDWNK